MRTTGTKVSADGTEGGASTMVEVMTQKVPLGVSACLADCPVRYNGKRFDALGKLGRERADFAITPVCPECMAGFGVPREPIHLTGTGQEVLAGTAAVENRYGRDVTAQLVSGAQACVEALERAGARVVILKEESPSCGLFRAKVGRSRRREALGSGVFGAMLAEKGWFLIPDNAFDSPLTWWDWRRRMHAWLWLSDRTIAGNGDLTAAWHVIKFVLQETGRKSADEMGRALAALPKHAPIAELEALRARMLEMLRTPTTRERAMSALWKTYSHARKSGTLDGVDLHDLTVRSPEVRRNVTTIAEELIGLERISFENDLLFGTTPVLYRERRRLKARDESLGTTSER
ncbi:MAG: DUF523 domain-containing protein [Actinobacteria bacterium]|nr:MAG: DUF523 domain-containing protein [Actinomycetota bacterium]